MISCCAANAPMKLLKYVLCIVNCARCQNGALRKSPFPSFRVFISAPGRCFDGYQRTNDSGVDQSNGHTYVGTTIRLIERPIDHTYWFSITPASPGLIYLSSKRAQVNQGSESQNKWPDRAIDDQSLIIGSLLKHITEIQKNDEKFANACVPVMARYIFIHEIHVRSPKS